jgi:hypothetical protein
MSHSLNIWEQQYEINCIYDEGSVAVNFKNDSCQYSFILTSATKILNIFKITDLHLIV